MRIRIVAIMVCLTIFGGCASARFVELSEMPEVTEDEALVYFYRESKFQGSAVSYYIYEGDEENKNRVGVLKNGSFFYLYREPGAYKFWAKTEAKDSVHIDLAAGEVYYVRGGVDIGFWAGRPELTLVHPTEGASNIPSLKYAVLPESVR